MIVAKGDFKSAAREIEATAGGERVIRCRRTP